MQQVATSKPVVDQLKASTKELADLISDARVERITAEKDLEIQALKSKFEEQIERLTAEKDLEIQALKSELERVNGKLRAVTEDETFDTQAEGAQWLQIMARLRNQRDRARKQAEARLKSLKRWYEQGMESGRELARKANTIRRLTGNREMLLKSIDARGGDCRLIGSTIV
ncbi:uncharacterized protein BDZ99DRAFT_467522 [Mytilinidion resinicola]|uniref:Uncharacterized protein n=1 Tax=Mytilinidion resinicola TaxID=574789 RepID=A0A6A6Y693_9PEZI|nr:uncharacterized protein BDZ99DRAFT_467522 [Mytilinidion resinicola]KAF2804129.1 hypothetical protein BDZ99DRAFT_467522 [Mytilinidion resinicola]